LAIFDCGIGSALTKTYQTFFIMPEEIIIDGKMKKKEVSIT